MNGVHDMGGMDGFGKVEPEPNEPMVHTDWEARVLAMVRAMGAAGAFNIDTSRFYREALPPLVYLGSSYYQKWLLGLEDLLVDKGFVAAGEIAAGHAIEPAKPLKRGKFTLADVERVMARGKFGAYGFPQYDAAELAHLRHACSIASGPMPLVNR